MAERSWFSVKNQAGGDAAEIYIYDEIGMWGVTAQDFVRAIKGLGAVDNLTVRINSPGGEIFDAFAIYNLLRGHSASVSVVVDGLAASAASFIAMSADPGKLLMPQNSFMMIHDPIWGIVGGVEDLLQASDALNKMRDVIASAYEQRTGKTQDAVLALMAAETWYTAQEAVDNGFADAITDPVSVAARFSLSRYSKAPTGVGTTGERRTDLEAEGMSGTGQGGAGAGSGASGTDASGAGAAGTGGAGQGSGGPDNRGTVVEMNPQDRAAEIADLCALANVPAARVSEYVRSEKTVAEVRADLIANKAQTDQAAGGGPTSGIGGTGTVPNNGGLPAGVTYNPGDMKERMRNTLIREGRLKA